MKEWTTEVKVCNEREVMRLNELEERKEKRVCAQGMRGRYRDQRERVLRLLGGAVRNGLKRERSLGWGHGTFWEIKHSTSSPQLPCTNFGCGQASHQRLA